MPTTLVWFRHDLRMADNAALHAAAQRGAVLPVYLAVPETAWPRGAASRVRLHGALAALQAELAAAGAPLHLARGDPAEILPRLIGRIGADALYFTRGYLPDERAQELALRRALAGRAQLRGFDGALLYEPDQVRSGSGTPFKVFTAFWKFTQRLPPPRAPLPAPARLHRSGTAAAGLALADLQLLPRQPWGERLRAAWPEGTAAGLRRCRKFLAGAVDAYDQRRDRPDLAATSRLSPWLQTGELSAHQLLAAWQEHVHGGGRLTPSAGALGWQRQLIWREFAWHLLAHFPHTTDAPLRPEFAAFPWEHDPAALAAWQRGRTGYPIVDAGMRELWQTGWMHNRVRMIAASFLIKHLGLHWLEGALWFWDTLLDADLGNNTLGWQWVAGCGADAAPYFRIFNPVTQGEKFDPRGAYVRRWLPELARLPAPWLQRPWTAPPAVLADAGVRLGDNYPAPLVDHAAARARSLARFERIRRQRSAT